MTTLFMLIGVPGSGKSSWRAKLIKSLAPEKVVVLSTDDYIDAEAEATGSTYSRVFPTYYKTAQAMMLEDLRKALESNSIIIWDQTNLTRAQRAKKLAMIPSRYRKVSVWFNTPEWNVLMQRLASRKGKHIPDDVMHKMISTIEPPSTDEGFDVLSIAGDGTELYSIWGGANAE